jgi:4-alpha-glucanotransferase
LNIIAEDLGRITPRVIDLLEHTGFPGMKLSQFAFGDEGNNATLPHGFKENTFAYTGTHDNETTKSWFKHVNIREKKHILNYLNVPKNGNVVDGLIRETLKSPSKVAIIPIQDYLELGDEGRMNEPATIGKNWRFRIQYKDLTMELQKRIGRLTKLYGRHPGQKNEGWIDRS